VVPDVPHAVGRKCHPRRWRRYRVCGNFRHNISPKPLNPVLVTVPDFFFREKKESTGTASSKEPENKGKVQAT
jgi:hypothetical protein